jgi:hypothetical protein
MVIGERIMKIDVGRPGIIINLCGVNGTKIANVELGEGGIRTGTEASDRVKTSRQRQHYSNSTHC